MPSNVTVVDCSGGVMGGARRYLDELDRIVGEYPSVIVVGRGQRLGARGLAHRELTAVRVRADRTVALNNVSFVTANERVLLLRNPLHFLRPVEEEELAGLVERRVHTEARVIRTLARRAHVVVTPTADMLRRVLEAVPTLAGRASARFHPVSRYRPPIATPDQRSYLACALLAAPWKRLGAVLPAFVEGLDRYNLGRSKPLVLKLTMTERELRSCGVSTSRYLEPIGHQTPSAAAELVEQAAATVYPTLLESFGYPMAEGRLLRRPVIAPDVPIHAEVGGDAHIPFVVGDARSAASAIDCALTTQLKPIGENPFDPDLYFRTLFG